MKIKDCTVYGRPISDFLLPDQLDIIQQQLSQPLSPQSSVGVEENVKEFYEKCIRILIRHKKRYTDKSGITSDSFNEHDAMHEILNVYREYSSLMNKEKDREIERLNSLCELKDDLLEKSNAACEQYSKELQEANDTIIQLTKFAENREQ